MKSFLIALVVLAIAIGVGAQFLISPVMQAYELCQATKQERMASLVLPPDQSQLVDYCTSSREALDDLSDCYYQAETVNIIAPYVVQNEQQKADSYQSAISKHTATCPNFPVGLE